MNGAETPSVQSLAEWLEIATAKLSSPAQERIRTEIEAHFTESVECHQVAGFSDVEARLEAVAELGDPRIAAKRFRKRHLTEKEEKRLRQISKYSRGLVWLLLSCVGDAFMCSRLFQFLKPDHSPYLFSTIAFCLMVLLQMIGFFVARCKNSKADNRLIVLMQILVDVCFTLFFVAWGAGVAGWAFGVVMAIGQARSLIPDLLLWHKLGHVDGVLPETPSRA